MHAHPSAGIDPHTARFTPCPGIRRSPQLDRCSAGIDPPASLDLSWEHAPPSAAGPYPGIDLPDRHTGTDLHAASGPAPKRAAPDPRNLTFPPESTCPADTSGPPIPPTTAPKQPRPPHRNSPDHHTGTNSTTGAEPISDRRRPLPGPPPKYPRFPDRGFFL